MMTSSQRLDDLARQHGLTVKREVFEAGVAVVVSAGARTLVTVTTEHGDVDANTQAVEHLRRFLHVAEAEAFRESQTGGIAEVQHLIDEGVWGLEGSMGRMMARAIESGACILGDRSSHDFWGTYIPAHWMVEDGTKGSVAYALAQQEED